MPRSHHQPQHTSRTPARTPYRGRQELGQNLLLDKRFPAAMADILRHAPPLPIVELGAGNGALTTALLQLGLPVTAIELDERAVLRLRRRFGGRVEVLHADLLDVEHPGAHHILSNVPFGITTPLLRALLSRQRWHTAVLLVQWEVARKRAAVGGTTLLTASWWPWYDFELGPRVPATAFTPVPAVDGGILVIRRREHPLLGQRERGAYQRLVRELFTGPGRGLAEGLRRRLPARAATQWLRRRGLPPDALPRQLSAEDWVSLFPLLTADRTVGRRPENHS